MDVLQGLGPSTFPPNNPHPDSNRKIDSQRLGPDPNNSSKNFESIDARNGINHLGSNSSWHDKNDKDKYKSLPGPNCLCDIPSAARTVRKEGSNFGKEFYACSKPQGSASRCDFFSWASEHETLRANFKEYQEASSAISETNDAKCKCDLFAVKKASKDDREYFSCPKSAGKCSYFSWIGEDSCGGLSRDFKPSTTRANQAYSGSDSSRTCFKCNQAGHYASECKQKTRSNSSLVCFNCNQAGHFASECPQTKNERSQSLIHENKNFQCFKCGDPGHLAPKCPYGNGNSTSKKRTYNKQSKSGKKKGNFDMPR